LAPLRQMWHHKGRWGAKKAYVGTKKAYVGAIKALGRREAYGAPKTKQAPMTFCQGKLDCASGMRMQSKADGSR
jgi:hypothetical protein